MSASPEDSAIVAGFLMAPLIERQRKERQRQYDMVPRRFNKGAIIELGNRLPVYDDNDVVIGKTNIGDRAVVMNTYADATGEHAEVVLISGAYIGYDSLCLDKPDIRKAKRIARFDQCEN